MVQIKKLSDSILEIEGEVPAEEFEKFCKKALENIKAGFELPGFRKGAVPEKLVIEKAGEGAIIAEAAEIALREKWSRIIKEEKLDILGQPKITVTKIAKGNPLGFKIEVATLPQIEIGDFKTAAKEMFSGEIKEEATEEEIQKALEYVKKGSETQMPGHKHDLESSEIKKAVKDNLEFEKNLKAKEKRRMEFLDKIATSLKVNLPDVLVEHELNKMIGELKGSLKNMGMEWIKYLEHVKKSEEDLRKEWREQAAKRIKYSLVLKKISEQENIIPAPETLDKRAEEILRNLPEDEREKASKDSLKEYLFGRMQNEMVFDFLEKLS